MAEPASWRALPSTTQPGSYLWAVLGQAPTNPGTAQHCPGMVWLVSRRVVPFWHIPFYTFTLTGLWKVMGMRVLYDNHKTRNGFRWK